MEEERDAWVNIHYTRGLLKCLLLGDFFFSKNHERICILLPAQHHFTKIMLIIPPAPSPCSGRSEKYAPMRGKARKQIYSSLPALAGAEPDLVISAQRRPMASLKARTLKSRNAGILFCENHNNSTNCTWII